MNVCFFIKKGGCNGSQPFSAVVEKDQTHTPFTGEQFGCDRGTYQATGHVFKKKELPEILMNITKLFFPAVQAGPISQRAQSLR
jgi:hypothetical protein